MHIIQKAVNEVEALIEDCGYEHNAVDLKQGENKNTCQYESGKLMVADFGGRTAHFVSPEPITARTKLMFVFGAPLKQQKQRAAAAAIINVVTGFLCISRKLWACEPEYHEDCTEILKKKIGENKIYCIGEMLQIKNTFKENLVENRAEADLILITGDGLITDEASDIEDLIQAGKVICLGPSTVGFSGMIKCEHFCPHGRS